MKLLKVMLVVLGMAIICCPSVLADSITSTGTATFETGTGFGNVLSILAVHQNGSEWGSVAWNGSNDVLAGDAAPGAQTNTITIGQLEGVGGSAAGFTVIFNVNQTGSSDLDKMVTMDTFTLHFYSPTGGDLGSLTWNYTDLNESNSFTLDGQGQGSSGYVFLVTLDTLASVFSNPDNHIGLEVPEATPIQGSNDGPEGFYVGGVTLVPEPGTLVLVGTVLVALVGGSRLRSKKR
jgi:hypothetical protein